MLNDKSLTDVEKKEFLNMISNNAEQSLELIHSILGVAALTKGKIT